MTAAGAKPRFMGVAPGDTVAHIHIGKSHSIYGYMDAVGLAPLA